MAVKFGFFDSLNGDRLYNANDISTMFEGIFSDGVFEIVGSKFQVDSNPGQMGILVGDGRAWFNNLWIRNTSTLSLTISPSHPALPRKDLVVLEFDWGITIRQNSIKVLTGIPSTTPIAPILSNTSTLKQYALAEVYIGSGVTSIINANITNKVGTTGTPYANSLVYRPSSTAINDFQIGNGIGGWIKKTLAEVIAILRTSLDNTYSAIAHTHDSLYATITHNHSGVYSPVIHTHAVYDTHISASSKHSQTYIFHNLGGTIPASSTYYAYVGLNTFQVSFGGAYFPRSGKVKNIFVRTNSIQPATGSLVITMQINAVNSTLSIIIPANGSANYYADTTHIPTFSAGNVLTIRAVNGATGASATINSFGFDIEWD